jgi:hypothetical protein
LRYLARAPYVLSPAKEDTIVPVRTLKEEKEGEEENKKKT